MWSCSTVKLVDLACLLFVPSCDLFYLLRYLGIFPVGDTFQSQPEAKLLTELDVSGLGLNGIAFLFTSRFPTNSE